DQNCRRRSLNHVVEEARRACEDESGKLRNYCLVLLWRHLIKIGHRARPQKERDQNNCHPYERGGCIARLWRLEGRHSVRDRFDTRERSTTIRESAEQKKGRERHRSIAL